MRSSFLRVPAALLVAGAVVACGQDDGPRLAGSSDRRQPDEFAILPGKPLQEPESYSELPPPTLSGRNRADASPMEDVITVLGGDPALASHGGIPSEDRQLVGHTDRYGRREGIRAELAVEDLEYRRQNQGRVLERLFNINVYFKAYEPMTLDQYAELERFRASGIRTPAAPPDPEGG